MMVITASMLLILLPPALIGWWLIGWLPTRMIKHYDSVTFTNLTWGRSDEAFMCVMSIIGPLNWLFVPAMILLWGGKWGWKW